MDALLKTDILEFHEAYDRKSSKSTPIKLCAYASEGEQATIATYTHNCMVLRTIMAKHRKNISSININWTGSGYGEPLALTFNVHGTTLAAVSSRYMYLLPVHVYLKRSISSKEGQVERIKLPAYISNNVSCCIWWQTALNKDIVIIGTKKGEIAFMDMENIRCIHTTNVNGEITRLELVPDDRQHTTFLLISGRSSLQWKLLLDILDHDLHLTMTQEQMTAEGYLFYGGKTYIRSILNIRHQTGGDEKEFEPQRFTQLPISVTLKYQNAKGCHLLSATDKVDSSLKIYDSSLEHSPLFIYSLPACTDHVVYTDRLIFVGFSGRHVQVLANQLSERDSSASKKTHIFYECNLEEGEMVLYMTPIKFSSAWYIELVHTSEDAQCKTDNHTILDGCLIITNKRLLQLVPNVSPEQLFLNWSAEPSLDMGRLETLARVTNIDILNLYLYSAEHHLANANAQIALDYLSCSKCDELLKISMLYKYKEYKLLIEISEEMLHSTSSQMSASVRADVSNMVLECYVASAEAAEDVTDGTEDKELSADPQFREFLLYNTDYSLDAAMTRLCQFGAVSLLLHLSLSRRFVCGALEHVFKQGKISQELLHEFITCREFVLALGTVLDGVIVRLLSPADLCTYLLIKEDIKQGDLLWLTLRLSEIHPDNLRLLAQRYHPHSKFVQMNIAKYRESTEAAAMQSYASLEQEAEDTGVHRSDDYISFLYMFYVKLVIALAPCISHECLLREDLAGLCSNSESNNFKEMRRTMELQYSKCGRILCCNSHTVYSLQRNALFEWGSKSKLDSLPVEDRVRISTPKIVELSMISASDIRMISCGEKHLMLLCTDGLYGTGHSSYGQVGAGGTREYIHPVKVDMKDCVDVICGRYHTLAIDKYGRLFTWGWGLFGQLGHDSIDNELSPKRVAALDDVFVISAAAGHSHSMVLSVQGEVWAFGNNAFGQVDVKRGAVKVSRPIVLELGGAVRHISTKYFHNVAVLKSGAVTRWGIQPFCLKKKIQTLTAVWSMPSQRSKGTKEKPTIEEMVETIKSCTDIDVSSCIGQIIQAECGSSHTIFLTDAGLMYAWVETQNELANPIIPLSLSDVVYVVTNSGYSLALTSNGTLYSWGRNNFGQLGLALRSVRYVERPGEVRIPVSYRRPSRADMHGTTVTEYLAPVGPDSTEYGPESRILDYDRLEMYRLCRAEAFPLQQSLSLFISSSVYPAAIAIFCSTSNWPEAFFYHLKSLTLCQGHLESAYPKAVLDVMEFYLAKINTKEQAMSVFQNQVTQILYRLLQFWQAKQLPTQPELQERLLQNLDVVAPPLYHLILGPEAISKIAGTFKVSFSTEMLASITKKRMMWLSQQVSSGDTTIAWTRLVKSLSNSSAVRASASLNHFDIDKLTKDTDKTDIIVFTCGHNLTPESLVNKALPTFESRVLSKLPVAGAAILHRYKQGDFQSIACPQCLYTSIRALIS
ncbi:uncharacterized protein [Watersipora subatra]|uniref:uncharacterized protein n=1 Tax=Watersipora subatra TaxID=2589382 RepID=UPI00355C12EC